MPASDFSTNSFHVAPDSSGVPASFADGGNIIYRGSPEQLLPPVVSNEIWQAVQQTSIVTQLARQTPISAAGLVTPIISGMPTAEWVGETREKPVTHSGVGSKFIKPYKIATIVPFSNEFRRDMPSLYNAFVQQLPLAISNLFDETVFFGPSPGTGFDTLANIPTVTINTATPGTPATLGAAYRSMLTALATVSDAGLQGDVSAWVLNLTGMVRLLNELDVYGQPFFQLTPNLGGMGSIGSILGAPVFKSKHVIDPTVPSTHATLGFAGDWVNAAVWGQIGGIEVSMSDQATIKDTDGSQLNLWQRNMFAVRVEATMVFGVKAVATTDIPFVRLISAT